MRICRPVAGLDARIRRTITGSRRSCKTFHARIATNTANATQCHPAVTGQIRITHSPAMTARMNQLMRASICPSIAPAMA